MLRQFLAVGCSPPSNDGGVRRRERPILNKCNRLVSTITPAQREYNPSLSGQHLGDNETQQQRFKTEEVNL
jgi:hypothetical protein